ncbi:hypothetical protein AZE42_06961 [Rhizopogon vesiculosus]|uniref:Uncharacterized protein n=1 Tax=Rhizopogon vesiculosus TaxID=180088 RepID=A0A1J8PLF2_9AGAM|nr:hypothetical protein AZE42_06961 [Rhizopogon vesiculosus]
MSEGSREV